MRSRHNHNLHVVDSDPAAMNYDAGKRALDAAIQHMSRWPAESETSESSSDRMTESPRAELPPISWRSVRWGLIAAGMISLALWWAIFAFALPALNAFLRYLFHGLMA